MGQRISYYKNDFSKNLKTLILENFSLYRSWYLEMNRDSMEEFDELFGNEELRVYFRQHTDIGDDFQALDRMLIDELTAEFICSYCFLRDYNSYFLQFFGPNVGKINYDSSTEMVIATKDETFIQLWNYLIKGRSLWDGRADFKSYTNEEKIGFLNRSELGQLKQKIETYFGTLEDIRQKASQSSGFGYVLSALSELDEYNVEIITVIDNG